MTEAQDNSEYSRSQLLLVPTKTLLPIASVVWLLAGFMVVYTGIAANTGRWTALMTLAGAIVFLAFLALFLMISRRHIRRIFELREPLSFILRFFDAPSYMIMVVMIFLGAAVRFSTFVPGAIIAWFYTGLGAALMVAGVYLLVSFCASLNLPKSRR